MKKIRKIHKHTFLKKQNAPHIVSKNETLIGGSIMCVETPTLHISKIMPICLLDILLKFN
jgi:hypothetical protein